MSEDEIKTKVNNAIEGWLARQRYNAKKSKELKDSIWQIFYNRDFYSHQSIEPKPTKADLESFDKSMFSFGEPKPDTSQVDNPITDAGYFSDN